MRRLETLDALRGLAALVVVLYHFSLVIPGVYDTIERILPLRVFVSGQSAVYVFFVLSGFVLYLSLSGPRGGFWLAFAVRRLARLYPPVAVAVLLSALLYVVIGPRPLPFLQGWFTQFSWTEYPTGGLVAGHLLLLDTDRFHSLDNPIWSLIVELRLSLVFPLIAAGVRRRTLPCLAACGVLSLVCHHALSSGHVTREFDLVFTGQYLGLFALGAFLAHRRDLLAVVGRTPMLPFLLLSLILLCIQSKYDWYFRYAGSTLLVALSASHSGLAKVYSHNLVAWLGRRSFSLYLLHVPVLLACVYVLAPAMPVPAILAIAFPLCLLATEGFWIVMEYPSIDFSRRLGRAVDARIADRRTREALP